MNLEMAWLYAGSMRYPLWTPVRLKKMEPDRVTDTYGVTVKVPGAL